ncbi:UNVERIFIED_ORG: hypothetical protein FHR35_007534 [Microbispora rosea subsp. rosea]
MFPLDAFEPTLDQRARLVNAVRHSVALCRSRPPASAIPAVPSGQRTALADGEVPQVGGVEAA